MSLQAYASRVRFMLWLSLLLATRANAQDNSVHRDVKVDFGFRDSVPMWMTERHVPTTAIATIEGGKVKDVRVFGTFDHGKPAPRNALFNVASLTKPIVALTVLKLVDAGRWDLDAPLSQFWIDPDIRDDPRHKKLTTRIILSHQTGFPNWRGSKKLAFTADPGSVYGYSGEGFEYLRRAVEKKFGRTLQQLSDSVLFKPVGMTATNYGWNARLDASRFAEAHDSNGAKITEPRLTTANAADWLVTTIDDYARFAAFMANGAGLSPALFTEMVKTQAAVNAKNNEFMGLGWEVFRDLSNGEYLLLHTGKDNGVATLVVVLPQSGRGLVVFTNGEKGMDVMLRVLKSTLHVKELTP
ncbi:MAG: serine hydrolase domain-containing protein [bacterium]